MVKVKEGCALSDHLFTVTSSNSSTTEYCCAGVRSICFEVFSTFRIRARKTLFLKMAVFIRSALVGRFPAARTHACQNLHEAVHLPFGTTLQAM